LPAEQHDKALVRFPFILLLPLATGLLVYACAQWAARDGKARWVFSRRPLGTELATTAAFLVGAYALVIGLGEVWLAHWYPLATELTNPAMWLALILGALAGAVTAYPVHLWLIGRGLLHWGPKAGTMGSTEQESG
jgi:hypothetical protein